MLIRDLLALQKRRVFRLPNYVRSFGLLEGLRLAIAIERRLPKTSRVVRAINHKNFPSPVYLRECISDHAIFWQCLVIQQYSLVSFKQTERLLNQYKMIINSGRRPVIIDAGGNIGLAAFWFAQVFPEAIVLTVEPEGDNFLLLQRNVAVFGDRVRSKQGGVTERPRRMRIVNPEAGASSFQLEPAADATEPGLTGFTIRELLDDVEHNELFLVKIDIEGGQKRLFAENIDWVDRVHLIIIEIDDWQFPWEGTSENFFRAVSKGHFDYLLKGENLFCFRHVSLPSNC